MSRPGQLVAMVSLALVTAACGGPDAPSATDTLTLYTCVSDTTIRPVIETFEEANPGTTIDLYRAPTGELNARVASDVRSGGLRADVVWACDPPTMQDYVDQGLVGGWTPTTDIGAEFRTDDYVGVAVLYVLAVSGRDASAPQAWSDLTGPKYADAVAVPDPAVAASALGALGWFAGDPDYGIDFYSALRANGAVQVTTPDDVVTGVAEGVYAAGITIANSAYAAQDNGSPIEVTWPSPGAIAVYGPVGLATEARDDATAQAFISYVASKDGQTQIAGLGSYPTLSGVAGPKMPDGVEVVTPDWSEVSDMREELLREHQKIFGG